MTTKMATNQNSKNKTLEDALDEIRLAFANFCADAQAIIDEAKERKKDGRN
jgi:hypothetical protein